MVKGLLIGAGVAGVGILLLRAMRRPEPAPQDPSVCDALPEPYRTYCKAASGLLDGIAGLNDKGKKHADEEKNRDATNQQLNGAVKVAMPGTPGGADTSVAWGVAGNGEPCEKCLYDADKHYIRHYGNSAKGTVMEFENGCQPFEGAPGWSKCAPGTKSMWATDIDEAFGYFSEYGDVDNSAEPAFLTLEALEAQAKKDKSDGVKHANGVQVYRPAVAAAFGTGSARLAGADVMTTGPYRAKDGRLWWLVKGKRIDCPVGQAPDVIRDGALGVVDHRTNPNAPKCVPVDSATAWTSSGPDYVPPSTGGDGGAAAAAGAGSGTRTELGCNGTQAPAGYTFDRTADGAWFLRRLRANETPNPGPCAPTTKLGTINAGTLAVTSGGTARFQG